MKQIFIKSTNNSAGLCRLLIPGGIFKDAAFFGGFSKNRSCTIQ
jgi:hypothetical protein